MLDTTEEITKKQLEIISSKTAAQRAKMGIDMINFTYNTICNVILSENPGISEKDLKKAIFIRFYANDFNKEELQTILNEWC